MRFCSDLRCWQFEGSCGHTKGSTMSTLRPPCPSCEKAGPAKFCDYNFTGEFTTIETNFQSKATSLEMYVARPKKLKSGLLLLTDIFGIKSPQVQFVADTLAQDGYLACVPDFFTPTYGAAWSFSDMPPQDPEEYKKFFAMINKLELIQELAQGAIRWMKEQGVDKIACLGFCWGGAIAIRFAGCASTLSLYAAGSVHPALTATSQDDYDAMSIPLLFCPSNGEKPEHIEQVQSALQHHPQKDKCIYRFFNVKHGYCATRGDWANNKEEREAAMETIALASKFFESLL